MYIYEQTSLLFCISILISDLLAVWIIKVEIGKLLFDSVVHGIGSDKNMFKTKLNENAFLKTSF